MIIHLVSTLPSSSNGLPRGVSEADRFIPPYLAFLPVGFAMPPMSPPGRWALTLSRCPGRLSRATTPPFHPYPVRRRDGIFSVALSFPSPGLCVTEHCVLWSSDFPPVPAITRTAGTGDHLVYFNFLIIPYRCPNTISFHSYGKM
ncbi:MAG: hypothetical protein HW390_1062 [Candidatus Brocadiaceae bacterium]|nr:hypothetical protein [Candidatus Brocadiaceae bacterium]